jgi:hypothetical protein
VVIASIFYPPAPDLVVLRSPFFRFLRELSAMPYCHNPHGLILGPVEEPIRSGNDFTKRKIRELRQQSSGLGKLPEAGKYSLRPLAKASRRRWVIPMNIGNLFKKLPAACRSK